ncbi:hypothetical protein MKX03_020384 [Papaver bracteatum]|nr:hypothetical protein MKX03_020384 [Papaver bracteatum]
MWHREDAKKLVMFGLCEGALVDEGEDEEEDPLENKNVVEKEDLFEKGEDEEEDPLENENVVEKEDLFEKGEEEDLVQSETVFEPKIVVDDKVL